MTNGAPPLDEARQRQADDRDSPPIDERNPPPATSTDEYNGAAEADDALGQPATPDDDTGLYGHTLEVIEPEAPGSGDAPAPPGMVKTGIGYVPEDAVRRARRSQPWPRKGPNLLKGRERQPVEWVVDGLIPKGEVTLLSGHGGLGKSTMLIQLQVATRLGKTWFGLPTTKMRSLGIYCEDKDTIVDNRFDYAIEHYGAAPAEIEEGLVWVVLRGGYHTYLCNFLPFSPKDDEEEPVVPSSAFWRLEEAIRDTKPGVVILDSLLKFFSGRMIDQLHVDGFYNHLARLCDEYDTAIILNGHPSQTGLKEGHGMAGNNAWHNCVRSRIYIERKTEQGDTRPRKNAPLVIRDMKSQYGAELDDITVAFDRQEHIFVRVHHDVIDWKANIINAILELEATGEKLIWNPEKKSQSRAAADRLIARHLGRKFPNAPKVAQTFALIREMLFGQEIIENGQSRFVGRTYLETADGWVNRNKVILLKVKENPAGTEASGGNYEYDEQ